MKEIASMLIVSLLLWLVTGYDFFTLLTVTSITIDLSFALLKVVKHLTNDKTARR